MASSNTNYSVLPFTTDGFNIASSQGKSDISTTKLNPVNARLTPPSNTLNIMEKITHLSNRLKFLTDHNTDFRVNVARRLENLKIKIRQIRNAIKILPGPNTPPTEEVNKLKQELARAQTAVETLTNEKAATAQERDKAKKDLQDANDAMTSLVSEIDKYVGLDFNNLNDVLQLVTQIEQEIESVESEIRNKRSGGSGPSRGNSSGGTCFWSYFSSYWSSCMGWWCWSSCKWYWWCWSSCKWCWWCWSSCFWSFWFSCKWWRCSCT